MSTSEEEGNDQAVKSIRDEWTPAISLANAIDDAVGKWKQENGTLTTDTVAKALAVQFALMNQRIGFPISALVEACEQAVCIAASSKDNGPLGVLRVTREPVAISGPGGQRQSGDFKQPSETTN